MTATIIAALLPLLTELANITPNSSTIGNILQLLINLIPTIVQEVEDLSVPVQNIITALKNSSAVTPQQIAVLESLDAQDDAALSNAVAGYNAANPGAPLTVPPGLSLAPPATPTASS